ncbi:hypothetical protein F4809DRAFT_655756 [Biscogniauxia mediterranea]|nr:hypothetical protein F4809DRAFT_655756 [Biscogniauxia mediterranea]
MKTSLFTTWLSLATSTLAQTGAPPPQLPVVKGIESETWTQCAPGQTLNVSIQPDKLSLYLPAMQFEMEGHGRTDESAICQFTMELTSWFYKYRLALSGVTYSGHFTADDGVSIYQLTASAVFQYENKKTNPMDAQPYIWNMSSSVMLDNTSPTSIGGAGPFDDDFQVVAAAAPSSSNTTGGLLTWSPCFDGGEGGGGTKTKLAFSIAGKTRDDTTAGGGGGGGQGKLVGGLTLEWDLAWQECVPDRAAKNAWGDTRVDDWQTCSYREPSGNATALGLRSSGLDAMSLPLPPR